MSKGDLRGGTCAGWVSHNAESGMVLHLKVNRDGEHSPCNVKGLTGGLLLQPV
jgi:hypothetical protein